MKAETKKPFYKWEVVLLLWFAYFLNQGDRQVFNTVLPHIQAYLGATDATMGLISTCFNIFFALTVPFAGYFADRLSRKKIIVFSVALFSVATMFTGLANTVILMILLRSVSTGMGEAMFGPTYPAIIAAWHGPATRARAMSLHQTAYYLGVIASGFLAGLIADRLGWQYSFFIFGSVGVVFALVLGFRLKDRPEGVAVESKENDKPSFFEALGAIFRVPTAVCMIVGFTSLIFVLTGYLTWMPKFLMDSFHLSGASAGLNSMLWTHAAAFVGVLLAGWLSDRVASAKGGAKNRLLLQSLGLLLASPCIVLMGMGKSLPVIYAALAGFGFFRAFFDANTYSILYDVIPSRYHSSSSAVLQMFGFGMGSLAPLILGLLSPVLGLSKGIALLGAVWVVAAVVMLIARFAFFDRDAEKLARSLGSPSGGLKTTEQDSNYSALDMMSLNEILEDINTEDKSVPEAVSRAVPQIQKLVEGIVSRTGRIFYMGAGTSGRLGVVDASEIPPTFGVRDKFIGIIAGGDGAFRNAVEGAEDSAAQGISDLMAFNPTPMDTLIGISASGSAPYVVGAVEKAREIGMLTGCICCNSDSALIRACECPVTAVVGPEFVTGSTRMKAGTATKMILNMISTSVMILNGHVQGNKMVDMQLTNKKLVDRGARMIMEKTGVTEYETAKALLLQYGSVRSAVESYLSAK